MLLPSQRKLTRMMLACIGHTKTKNSKSKKKEKKKRKKVNNYTHLLLSPLNMSSPTDILKHTHTRLIYIYIFIFLTAEIISPKQTVRLKYFGRCLTNREHTRRTQKRVPDHLKRNTADNLKRNIVGKHLILPTNDNSRSCDSFTTPSLNFPSVSP